MLRGSRPGERRGGRKRDTPNRRTILTERILAIGSDHPTASWRAFLTKLVKDRQVPADTLMAVARECFPAKRTRSSGTRRPRVSAGMRSAIAQGGAAKAGSVAATKGPQNAGLVAASQDWNPRALDALFGIVQDAAAAAKMRRRAALKIAEFLLPKSAKKPTALPDQYGFKITPELASAYRDMHLELRSLMNAPTRVIPAIAQKIQKLKARSDAVLRRLQCPCPTRYGYEQVVQDFLRLGQFTSARDDEIALTEAQDAEEAHLKARFDVFAAGPEQTARRRRKVLQRAERRQKASLVSGDFYAPPLSRQEHNDLTLLRRLYPEPQPNLSASDRDEWAIAGGHPFLDELPASDGNLYPRDSKLRPASARAADDRVFDAPDGPPISPVGPGDARPAPPDDDGFIEFVDLPRYIIGNPNHPGTSAWKSIKKFHLILDNRARRRHVFKSAQRKARLVAPDVRRPACARSDSNF
jgi:hypothetical protein